MGKRDLKKWLRKFCVVYIDDDPFIRELGVRKEMAGFRLKIGLRKQKNLVITKFGELNRSCRDEMNRNLCTLLKA